MDNNKTILLNILDMLKDIVCMIPANRDEFLERKLLNIYTRCNELIDKLC